MILRKANNAERCQIRMLYRSVIGTPGCTWDDSYPDEENLSADLHAGTLFLLVDDVTFLVRYQLFRSGNWTGFPGRSAARTAARYHG